MKSCSSYGIIGSYSKGYSGCGDGTECGPRKVEEIEYMGEFRSAKELIKHVSKYGSLEGRAERYYLRRHFHRFNSTIACLGRLDFDSVLDLGCGLGDFLLMLGRRGIGVATPYEVKFCKERGIEAYPVDLEKETLPFPIRPLSW